MVAIVRLRGVSQVVADDKLTIASAPAFLAPAREDSVSLKMLSEERHPGAGIWAYLAPFRITPRYRTNTSRVIALAPTKVTGLKALA